VPRAADGSGIVTETGSGASGGSDRISAWLRSTTVAIASRPRSSSARWLYLRVTLSYRDVEELLAE
jgi:hypothetical protein